MSKKARLLEDRAYRVCRTCGRRIGGRHLHLSEQGTDSSRDRHTRFSAIQCGPNRSVLRQRCPPSASRSCSNISTSSLCRQTWRCRYGGSHSALTVKIDGKEAYVDPDYGFAAIGDDGHLVSIADLWANLQVESLSKSLRQIALIPDITYYEKWHQTIFTFQTRARRWRWP